MKSSAHAAESDGIATFFSAVVLLAAFLLLLSPSAGDGLTIQPSRADSYMDKWLSDSNDGNDTSLMVQSWFTNYHQRSMVVFDLSGIPGGSSINNATLYLYLYNAYPQTRTYGVHRINADRDWIEDEVTWNNYRIGSGWSSGGGDFIAAASDAKSVGWSIGWVSWDVMQDVQLFVDNPGSNNGWIIKDENEAYTPQYYKWFYSREYGSASLRPKLEVDFDEPLPVELSSFTAVLSGGDVILSWRTESEVNNLGFNVYRGEARDGSFWKLTESLIPGAGSSPVPRDYEFVDQGVEEGMRYFYYLEDMDSRGQRNRSETIDIFVPIISPKGSGPGNRPGPFALFQNYPNPCNPRTCIPYFVASSCHVDIRIYSSMGRPIRTLFSGMSESGEHWIFWDGRNDAGERIATGVYYYALQSGEFTAVRKMMIMK